MNTIFSTNFDSDTTGAISPGFVNGVGSWLVGTAHPVSGAKTFSASGDDNTVLYTGVAALADMDLTTAFVVLASGSGMATISHLLRFSSNFQNGYKAIAIAPSGSTINLLLQKAVGGAVSQVGSVVTGAMTGLVDGDIVRMKSKIVGSAISIYLYKNAEAVPATPTATFTDASVTAAGYAGLQNVFYLANTAAAVDDFVITDAAAAVTAPGAPTIGVATAGVNTASVTFTAPGSNGGSAITGYIATASTGETATGTASPIAFGTLSAGVARTIHVQAINSAGTGAASAESNSVSPTASSDVTPPTLTGSVTLGAVTSTSIAISYAAGADNVAVAGYECSVDGGSTYVSVGNVTNPTLGGLTSSTAYPAVKVRAFDAAGNKSNPAIVSASGFTTSAAASQMALIEFSPGNWNVTGSRATSINPGACFKTLFTGNSCTLNFDVSGNSGVAPQIKYRIDHMGPWTTTDIAATVALSLAGGISDFGTSGGHVLEVEFKSFNGGVSDRWNLKQSALALTGITLDSGGTLALPPVALARKILFFGDSIPEGVIVTAAGLQDAGNSAASEAGRLLSSQFGIVGFASQGFTQVGQCAVPIFGSTWDKIYSGVARSFAGIDLIVIMQGQNDGNANLTSVATSVLTAMLAGTPSSTKIVVMTPLSGNSASSLMAAVAAINNPRLTSIDTTGYKLTGQVHPYVNENITRIAPSMVNALLPLLSAPVAAPALTSRTVTLSGIKIDKDTLATGLTNVKVSFRDAASPDVAGAITYQSATQTITGGVLTFPVSTSLAPGALGWLDVKAPGVHYCGPVAVA